MRNFLLSQATPHDLGGAGPASAMSALLAGLRINEERGEMIRDTLYKRTKKAYQGLRELGYTLNSHTDFPIISVWLGTSDDIIEISNILYNNHILLTLSPYPMVKKREEALRLTITASNTEKEVEQLLIAFSELKEFLSKKGYKFEEKKRAS